MRRRRLWRTRTAQEVAETRARLRGVRRLVNALTIPYRWKDGVKLTLCAHIDRIYERGDNQYPLSAAEVSQATGLSLNTAKKANRIVADLMPFHISRSTTRTRGPGGLASEWHMNLDVEAIRRLALARGFTFDDPEDSCSLPDPTWSTSETAGEGGHLIRCPENTEVDQVGSTTNSWISREYCHERRDLWALRGGLGRAACRLSRYFVKGGTVPPGRRRWTAVAKATSLSARVARRATERLLERGVVTSDPDGTLHISGMDALPQILEATEKNLPSHGRMDRLKQHYAARREQMKLYWERRHECEEEYYWTNRRLLSPIGRFRWEKWLGYREWDEKMAA